jgi:hypothetical protein
MKRKTLLKHSVTILLVLAVLVFPLSLSVSGQGAATTRTIYTNATWMFPGASSGTCHHFELAMGAARPGDILAGGVSSDLSGLVLTIMTISDFQGTANFCSGLAGHSRYYKEGQSFQFQWTVSDVQAYYIVLVNTNSAQITATVTAYIITNSPGQSYTPTSQTYNPVSSAAATPTASATNMPPMASPLALPFDPLYLAIGLGVVVLLAFLPWLARSSGKPKPVEMGRAPPMRQQTTQVTRDGIQRQFCLNCGRQIPAGSRFCGKCGAAQTQA